MLGLTSELVDIDSPALFLELQDQSIVSVPVAPVLKYPLSSWYGYYAMYGSNTETTPFKIDAITREEFDVMLSVITEVTSINEITERS